MLRERLDIIAAVSPYIGKFFSGEYVRKNFLKQSDEEILEIDSQINRETQKQLETQDIQQYQQMMSGEEPEESEEESTPEEEQQK
ncbi:MAG: hypothetical protein EB127_28840 [Alphaproteobacteria bacterium]|nr:hypothetical protein [Alphaproteobacteria bacterium]